MMDVFSISILIGAAVSFVLINALVLQGLVHTIVGFRPKYRGSLGAVFVSYLLTVLLHLYAENSLEMLSYVIDQIIYAYLITRLVRGHEGQALSMKKALLVSFAPLIVAVQIVLFIFVIVLIYKTLALIF